MKLASVQGQGPLVVKLAGIAGGIGLYAEEMAAAARAGFRVAALDTTGDRFDDPLREPLSWDGLARDVVAGISAAGERRAILWGTSYGCVVALAAAARHPERVAGLLLSSPPDPEWQPKLHRRVMAWTLRRRDPDRAARLVFSTFYLSVTCWEIVSPFLWARLPALARASKEAATPGSTIRQKIEILWTEDPGIHRIDGSIPVSIVTGRWDAVAPYGRARRLASILHGAPVRRIAFAGHAVAYARPKAYRQAVARELDRLAAQRRDSEAARVAP